MKGDQNDMIVRLRQTLPQGWMPLESTAISGVLSGMAKLLSYFYSLLFYVRGQTRILSAEAGILDLVAGDFFGLSLRRGDGELDDNFRARILVQMFRERATRSALVAVVRQLTGRDPVVIEPGNPVDTGALGATLALGQNGCVGSLAMPYQAFVTVYRSASNMIPGVPGLGSQTCFLGGGMVLIAEQALHSVADRNIYAAIDAVKPAGTTVWTRITS